MLPPAPQRWTVPFDIKALVLWHLFVYTLFIPCSRLVIQADHDSILAKRLPARSSSIFGNKKKSDGARSVLYGIITTAIPALTWLFKHIATASLRSVYQQGAPPFLETRKSPTVSGPDCTEDARRSTNGITQQGLSAGQYADVHYRATEQYSTRELALSAR